MAIPRIAVIAWGPHELPRRAARGIQAYSDAHSRWLLDVLPVDDEWSRGRIATYDGVIGFMPKALELRRMLLQRGIPAFNLSGHQREDILPRVLPDNYAVGRLAAEFLIAKGIRRMAFLDIGTVGYGIARGEGFLETAEANGCEVLTRAGHTNPEQVIALVKSAESPVGVFAPNDGLARRCVFRALEAGCRVPEELAVIGVDNTELICTFGPVPLTSVDPDGFACGWQAARRLERWLQTGRPERGDVLVRPKGVVERQSTDFIAGGDPLTAEAIRYIRTYARHGVSVSEVARRFGMSCRTLERRICAVLGHSPLDEIRRVRFAEAKRLLREGDMIVAEVSRRSGFGNAKHFAREFKSTFGLTPGAYRRGHGGSSDAT